MAPKKDAEEERWEEAERVGPYQLHEPISDSANAQGELFRATNPETGATALVLKLAKKEGDPPLPDWKVQCTSSSAHHSVAMEVDSSPWCFSKDKQSAEELVCTFEGVRDGMQLMDQHLSDPPNESRLPRRPVLVLAGLAAACALVFFCVVLTQTSQPVVQGVQVTTLPEESMRTVIPSTDSAFIDALDGGMALLARPLPSQPLQGQKRPPCDPRAEVEIMGACWVPHKLKAPCPDVLYEYQGECFIISMLPPPLPRSAGQ